MGTGTPVLPSLPGPRRCLLLKPFGTGSGAAMASHLGLCALLSATSLLCLTYLYLYCQQKPLRS